MPVILRKIRDPYRNRYNRVIISDANTQRINEGVSKLKEKEQKFDAFEKLLIYLEKQEEKLLTFTSWKISRNLKIILVIKIIINNKKIS